MSQNVNVPSISPDGRYVAYCTADDGANGPANVYLRSLDTLAKCPGETTLRQRIRAALVGRSRDAGYVSDIHNIRN